MGANAQEFNPQDAGLFWGDALCHVLGGADYLSFGQVTTPAGEVICALPVFGQPVLTQQFTAEQLSTVVSVAAEIQDAAPTAPEGIVPGSPDWILGLAVQTTGTKAPGLDGGVGSRPVLEEALFIVAFWLLNAEGGLLDLTGMARPW